MLATGENQPGVQQPGTPRGNGWPSAPREDVLSVAEVGSAVGWREDHSVRRLAKGAPPGEVVVISERAPKMHLPVRRLRGSRQGLGAPVAGGAARCFFRSPCPLCVVGRAAEAGRSPARGRAELPQAHNLGRPAPRGPPGLIA